MDEAQQDLDNASEPFGVSTAELAAMAAMVEKADALLLDVRRQPAFDAARQMLPGAVWRNPECRRLEWQLQHSSAAGGPCHDAPSMIRAVPLEFTLFTPTYRSAGVEAPFLRGGIDVWQQDGRPLVDKPAG